MPENIITIAELDAITTAPDSSYIPIDNGTTTNKITVENFNASSTTTAAGYAAAAAQSASDAADSAADALSYKNTIQGDIATAAEFVTDARGYKEDASNYATAAQGYATQAGNSKDAAAISAGAAAGSATSASGYASTASSAASSASASAADALGYKDGAALSAEQAATYASYVEAATVHPAYIGENYDWYVWDAENNEYVDTEILATGNPGISPEVSTTPISNGTRVTITDITHPTGQSFDVLNGTGAGDMLASTYDSDSAVAMAGGISGYVASAISGKMDKANPTGTGSLSLNRKENTTVGTNSVAVGYNSTASGNYSHAEGQATTASGMGSHAEGYYTTASSDGSHAEGDQSTASGMASHAEGYITTASSNFSHAEGRYTEAKTNNAAHAEGYGYNGTYKVIASGKGSHAEGVASSSKSVTASGDGAHAEGYATTASGNYSHAEGYNTTASGNYSHAEGFHSTASSDYSHAEGTYTVTSEVYSHAEGQYTEASAPAAHAEGFGRLGGKLTASGQGAHAEGYMKNKFYPITASGYGAHAEGYADDYTGITASGNGAHAEGCGTTASGDYSHAGGYKTAARYTNQTVVGKYNDNKSDTVFEVGNGNIVTHSNGFEVYTDGSLSTDNGTNKAKLPIFETVTLAQLATSVAFDLSSYGNHLVEFFTSVPGLDYTAISVSNNVVTLTFEAQSEPVTVYAKITEITSGITENIYPSKLKNV